MYLYLFIYLDLYLFIFIIYDYLFIQRDWYTIFIRYTIFIYLLLLQNPTKTNTAGECFETNTNVFQKCLEKRLAAWDFGGQVSNFRVLIFIKTE